MPVTAFLAMTNSESFPGCKPVGADLIRDMLVQVKPTLHMPNFILSKPNILGFKVAYNVHRRDRSIGAGADRKNTKNRAKLPSYERYFWQPFDFVLYVFPLAGKF
jgi:hypothetical protein